jgi:hypothetical protein
MTLFKTVDLTWRCVAADSPGSLSCHHKQWRSVSENYLMSPQVNTRFESSKCIVAGYF